MRQTYWTCPTKLQNILKLFQKVYDLWIDQNQNQNSLLVTHTFTRGTRLKKYQRRQQRKMDLSEDDLRAATNYLVKLAV